MTRQECCGLFPDGAGRHAAAIGSREVVASLRPRARQPSYSISAAARQPTYPRARGAPYNYGVPPDTAWSLSPLECSIRRAIALLDAHQRIKVGSYLDLRDSEPVNKAIADLGGKFLKGNRCPDL